MKIRIAVSNEDNLTHKVHLALWIQSKKVDLHGVRTWQAHEVNDMSKIGECDASQTLVYTDMSIVNEHYLAPGSVFSLHTLDRVTHKVRPIATMECTALDIQPLVISNELCKDVDGFQLYYVKSVTLWVKKLYSKAFHFDADENICIGYEG